MADVAALLPRVVEELDDADRATKIWEKAAKEKRDRRPKNLDPEAEFALDMEAEDDEEKHWRNPDIVAGFARWRERDPGRGDAILLLECIKEAKLERRKIEWPEGVGLERRFNEGFDERWERAKRYWQNVAFELAYLTALILFAAWPWLRGGRPLVWAIHLGLVPLLLFLPYYLGYCSLTFTSAGPSGGVLYPQMLARFSRIRFWTPLDVAIMQWLPKPLEGLSQESGPMLSLSGGGGCGPLTVMAIGLVIGVIAFSFAYLAQDAVRETGRWIEAMIEWSARTVPPFFDRLGRIIEWVVSPLAWAVAPLAWVLESTSRMLRARCPWIWSPIPPPWKWFGSRTSSEPKPRPDARGSRDSVGGLADE